MCANTKFFIHVAKNKIAPKRLAQPRDMSSDQGLRLNFTLDLTKRRSLSQMHRRKTYSPVRHHGQFCEHGRRCCRICTPLAWLASLLQKRFAESFRRRGWSAPCSALEALGCSWRDCYEHLSAKCTAHNTAHPDRRPMTVANTDCDHIKATSLAENPQELAALMHFTNVQPLFHDDNMHKGSRWSAADEEFWTVNIFQKPGFLVLFMPAGTSLLAHQEALELASIDAVPERVCVSEPGQLDWEQMYEEYRYNPISILDSRGDDKRMDLDM